VTIFVTRGEAEGGGLKRRFGLIPMRTRFRSSSPATTLSRPLCVPLTIRSRLTSDSCFLAGGYR